MSLLFNTQNCNSEDAEWDVVGEEDLGDDDSEDSDQGPKLVTFQILPGLFIVLLPIVVVVGIAGVVQYVTGRWNLRPWNSQSPAEQPATTDERTPESRLKQAETTQTEVEEWLTDAEAARQRGNDAMEAGDHNRAAEAYRTALKDFQTVRDQLPADDDRHQTVETVIEEVQDAHKEAVQHSDQQPPATQDAKPLNYYVSGEFSNDSEQSNSVAPPQNESNNSPDTLIEEGDAMQAAGPAAQAEDWLGEAEAARQHGNHAMEVGEYDQAVDAYATALVRFRTARDQLPDDDDRHHRIETIIEEMQAAYQEALQQRDQQSPSTQDETHHSRGLPANALSALLDKLPGTSRKDATSTATTSVEPAADNEPQAADSSDNEPPADPDEVLADAEELLTTARDARDASNYDQALEALDTALDRFEHLQTTDANPDADIDVDSRLTALRQRRREVTTERKTVADIQERLETAEDRLATADEAYDNANEVVARLRYRQARDIYADVLERLWEADLEEVTVTAGGHQFEGVTDIETRHQTATDGFERTQ